MAYSGHWACGVGMGEYQFFLLFEYSYQKYSNIQTILIVLKLETRVQPV